MGIELFQVGFGVFVLFRFLLLQINAAGSIPEHTTLCTGLYACRIVFGMEWNGIDRHNSDATKLPSKCLYQECRRVPPFYEYYPGFSLFKNVANLMDEKLHPL